MIAERIPPDDQGRRHEAKIVFANVVGLLVRRTSSLELWPHGDGDRFLDVSSVGVPPWKLQAVALSSDVLTVATTSCLHAFTAEGDHWWHDVGDVQGVAAGDGWVAALTQEQMLLLYTKGGAPFYTFKAVGEADRIAALDSKLAVFSLFSDADESTTQETLWLQEYAVPASCTEPRLELSTPVPLPRDRSISWAGYTEEGSIAVSDNEGCVHVRQSGGCWIEVSGRHRHPRRIVRILETEQSVWYLRKRHWPAEMDVVKFALPCHNASDEEYAGYEERLSLASLQLDVLRRSSAEGVETLERDVAMARVFSWSLAKGLESRALEVAAAMEPRIQKLAFAYAAKRSSESFVLHLRALYGEDMVPEEQEGQQEMAVELPVRSDNDPAPEPAPGQELTTRSRNEGSASGSGGRRRIRRRKRGGRKRRRARRSRPAPAANSS